MGIARLVWKRPVLLSCAFVIVASATVGAGDNAPALPSGNAVINWLMALLGVNVITMAGWIFGAGKLWQRHNTLETETLPKLDERLAKLEADRVTPQVCELKHEAYDQRFDDLKDQLTAGLTEIKDQLAANNYRPCPQIRPRS